MTHKPRDNSLVLVIVATVIVLISRLPFLAPGYGADPDAWRLASASRLIAETGAYHESRSPGHPVQEWACSLLWQGGPRALNGATAVVSALACLFFGLALVEFGAGRWAALGALALGFTPIVYIHSVDSMDYVWALCFSMAALWLVLSRRWWAAGVALGLAIGSRMTAGALLFPLFVLGWMRAGAGKRGGLLVFTALALGVGGALYLPDVAQQGLRFLRFSQAPYPGPMRLLQDTTLEIWGTIGGVGLVIALAIALVTRRGKRVLPSSAGLVASALLAIALYVAAFLRLPDEPAYLIPIIPFVILLLARFSRPALFAAACACLIVSPFVLDLGRPESEPTIRPGEFALPSGHPVIIVRPAKGALLVDRNQRVTGMTNAERILTASDGTQRPAVVVVSSWLPQLEVMARNRLAQGVRLTYFVRAGEADSLVRGGTHLYYVPGSETTNQYYEHVDLPALGARPLSFENAW